MRQTKELIIGLSTFAALICFIWGYNFLKGKNVFTQKRDYYAFYDHVHGLEVGRPVTINGFKIGQVTDITFDASYGGKLLVDFNISEPMEFASDSKVQIYDMDIMGAKGVELIIGSNTELATPGDTLVGDIKISLTEQVTKQFVPIKDGTEKLISVLDSTLKSITLLTNKASELIEANHTSITNAAGNIDTLAEALNNQRKDFETVISNLKQFSSDLVDSDVDQTVKQVGLTMKNFDSILQEIQLGEGSLGKLVKDAELYTGMTKSMTQLEILLKDMREHPKRYVHFSMFGKKESPVDTIK
jgi:phospholipid/cholesterol/gamma-HCH transport system substrate-binding protein